MKTIYAIRHGETWMNLYTKMQGWSDTPLTKNGIKGAKKLGKILKDVPIDIAVTSDLKRASDSCKIIVNEHTHSDQIRIIE